MLNKFKLWAILAGSAIIGILKIMLGIERSKRKAAELRARIEESNRKNLETAAKAQADIEKERKNWDEKLNDEHKQKLKEIQKLDENTSNADFITNSAKLLNRSNRKN